MTLKERYKGVLDVVNSSPTAHTELIYNSSYELIVAIILSAQCTDKRVNLVTPALFEAFPTVQSMAFATKEDIFDHISSISYPNNKAKHLAEMARQIVRDFEGEIPSTREELMTLAGVGRKTANVMLTVYFNKPAMPVDTHVFRVSARIGLVHNAKTPNETELQLVKWIPREMLSQAHHWFLLHGRYTCKSRKPLCQNCSIRLYCSYFAQKGKA